MHDESTSDAPGEASDQDRPLTDEASTADAGPVAEPLSATGLAPELPPELPPDADAPVWAPPTWPAHDLPTAGRSASSGNGSGARVEIHQGGSDRIEAQEVSIFQGGAATIRGQQIRVEQGGAFAIIGKRIDMRESGAFILIAKRTTGDVRVLLDWRAIVGLVVGLAVLLVVRGRR